MDDCDQCDIHALCVKGACRCRVGYKGDGFECEKSEYLGRLVVSILSEAIQKFIYGNKQTNMQRRNESKTKQLRKSRKTNDQINIQTNKHGNKLTNISRIASMIIEK